MKIGWHLEPLLLCFLAPSWTVTHSFTRSPFFFLSMGWFLAYICLSPLWILRRKRTRSVSNWMDHFFRPLCRPGWIYSWKNVTRRFMAVRHRQSLPCALPLSHSVPILAEDYKGRCSLVPGEWMDGCGGKESGYYVKGKTFLFITTTTNIILLTVVASSGIREELCPGWGWTVKSTAIHCELLLAAVALVLVQRQMTRELTACLEKERKVRRGRTWKIPNKSAHWAECPQKIYSWQIYYVPGLS